MIYFYIVLLDNTEISKCCHFSAAIKAKCLSLLFFPDSIHDTNYLYGVF